MKKYLYAIIACFCLLTAQAQTRSGTVTFPLTDGNGSPPPGVVSKTDPGGNAPNGYQRYTSEGTVLTRDRVSYSAIALDNLEIDLREGLTVEFEYAMASVPPAAYGKGEGMTFFIFDASRSFEIGYGFEALGYAYNEANSNLGRKKGVLGAYLAVGFDIGGGFHKHFENNEYRREGISAQRFSDAGFSQADFGRYRANHVTLRGAHADFRQGGGFNGNPVLLTKYFGGFSANSTDVSMATLNYRTGQYNFGFNSDAASFDVGNGGSEANPNFQKIRVELEPVSNGNGMYVTVKAIEGSREIMLIDRFQYETNFKTFDKLNDLYDFSAPIPHRVKIGFSAATGNFTQQKTIIRNVKVSIPNALILPDVTDKMCVSDNGNSRNAAISVSLFEEADFSVNASSFKFLDSSGSEVGTSYTQSNVGRWEYSSRNEEVTLTLTNGNFEPGDVAEVHYIVEARDGTKAQPATIRITGIACGATINPQIQVKDQNAPYLR
ncbi:hypothetical protein [Myroides fluvii]|uniref:hypothetical protein n=1 Tax=Myroides fluvii TaxID=2572594 RepID=UPI00131BDA75|nr:hypothetical protein [Myroides fluvii]